MSNTISNFNTLSVLQYNTHLFIHTLPGDAASITGDPDDNRLIFHDSTRLSVICDKTLVLGPDIVGFSEVWANSSKNYIMDRLKSQYRFAAWDENNDPLQMGSGLLLLSKHPLEQVSFTEYTSLVGDDWLSQKGFLMAKATVGTQSVFIMHTHTQSGSTKDRVEARNSNLRQLVDALNALDGVTPTILLGDLNVVAETGNGSQTDEYILWTGELYSIGMIGRGRPSGLVDAYPQLHTEPSASPGFTYDAVHNYLISRFAPSDTSSNVQQRIDYQFTRGLTPSRISIPSDTFIFDVNSTARDLSDHYPLYGVYNLP